MWRSGANLAEKRRGGAVAKLFKRWRELKKSGARPALKIYYYPHHLTSSYLFPPRQCCGAGADGAGAEMIFLINIYCSQFGGCYRMKKN